MEEMMQWYNQISSFPKLKITEAQALYKKAINTKNQNLNQNYTPNYNNQNVQYNSAAPVQQGSEVRINPDVRYEKPH